MVAYSRIFTWDSDTDTFYLHNGGWWILIGLAVVIVLVAIFRAVGQ